MNKLFCLLLTLLTIGQSLIAQLAGPADIEHPKKPTPFIDRVVMFQRGSGGGNGEDKLPDIVLGPPQGGGRLEAGRDVLSLGEGGSITVEFVDNEVFDGPGPDFIVFENPFLAAPGNDPDFGFFELAKVEVSFDGETWTGFPYDTASRKGCAGHHPVLANAEKNEIDPTNPKIAGGDAFDLKEIGIKVVRFVRITDVQSFGGDDGAAGFDLDAVTAVHSRPRPAEKPSKK
ncbi:hypothetical protein GC176_12915 [bacterium]|nr:hypothetical protein [bacterium]